jgi:hypothetical protein
LVSNDAQYGLKLYESLLIHEVVGNERGSYQIHHGVRIHTARSDYINVTPKYNGNADVVCEEMSVHVGLYLWMKTIRKTD